MKKKRRPQGPFSYLTNSRRRATLLIGVLPSPRDINKDSLNLSNTRIYELCDHLTYDISTRRKPLTVTLPKFVVTFSHIKTEH